MQNSKPGEMTSLVQVMEKLKSKNYDTEFVITSEGFSAGKGKTYQPDQLVIIKTYRFEGESDPGDSIAIYLIEADDGLIGYTIDAYGAASNHDDDGYDEFLKRIPLQDREDQLLFE